MRNGALEIDKTSTYQACTVKYHELEAGYVAIMLQPLFDFLKYILKSLTDVTHCTA